LKRAILESRVLSTSLIGQKTGESARFLGHDSLRPTIKVYLFGRANTTGLRLRSFFAVELCHPRFDLEPYAHSRCHQPRKIRRRSQPRSVSIYTRRSALHGYAGLEKRSCQRSRSAIAGTRSDHARICKFLQNPFDRVIPTLSRSIRQCAQHGVACSSRCRPSPQFRE
jgi:hypothetical protein